ncbi:MAG: DUF547 domain-containing protein [Rhodospirillaceae bacterium]
MEKKLIAIEGPEVSLDDIEHRILRPIWKDPRIHYAVNCASVGCPDLLAEPFRADRADAVLTAAARAYINHPRGAAFNAADSKLTVSKIYDRFEADFGGSEKAVIRHLSQYAEGPFRARLEKTMEIADYVYD